MASSSACQVGVPSVRAYARSPPAWKLDAITSGGASGSPGRPGPRPALTAIVSGRSRLARPSRRQRSPTKLTARMAELDGRVIAIAGAAGGLGPTVAAPPRRRRRHPRAHRPRPGAPRRSSRADLGLAEDRIDAPRRRPARRGRRARVGRARSPSASATSTACSTWSAAGGAASRSRPRRSPTTSCSTTCWSAPSSTPPAPSTTRSPPASTAASSSSPPRRRRSPTAPTPPTPRPRPRPRPGRSPSPTRFAGRLGATANIVVVNAILTPQMREENPDKPYPTFTSAEDIADAIAFLCSDAAAKMNGKRLALHP